MRANRQTAREAHRLAYAMSSGPVPAWVMRHKKWHPFAKNRHPSPQLDPEIMNLQGGGFRRGWKTRNTPRGAVLYNDSEVAAYLRSGTRTMFDRPIDKAIIRLMKPVQAEILKRALRP